MTECNKFTLLWVLLNKLQYCYNILTISQVFGTWHVVSLLKGIYSHMSCILSTLVQQCDKYSKYVFSIEYTVIVFMGKIAAQHMYYKFTMGERLCTVWETMMGNDRTGRIETPIWEISEEEDRRRMSLEGEKKWSKKKKMKGVRGRWKELRGGHKCLFFQSHLSVFEWVSWGLHTYRIYT